MNSIFSLFVSNRTSFPAFSLSIITLQIVQIASFLGKSPLFPLYSMVLGDGIYLLALLIEAFLVLLADCCFFLLFLGIPLLREGPGQLILAQTLWQIVVELHWLVVLYWDIHNSAFLCTALNFVAYLGFVVTCVYAAAICVAVSLHFDRPSYPKLWCYHAAVLVTAVGFALGVFVGNRLMVAEFDLCIGYYTHRNFTE